MATLLPLVQATSILAGEMSLEDPVNPIKLSINCKIVSKIFIKINLS